MAKKSAWPITFNYAHVSESMLGRHVAHHSPAQLTTRKASGGNWIAGAIKHPGALSRKAARAGQSPMAFARSHTGASGTTGRQARLAVTLSKLRKKG